MKNLIIGIFMIFITTNPIYSCDDIEVHKKVINYILDHEGDKVLKTKSEYSKYGIRNSLLKRYNKKNNLNYTIKTLNKEKATEIALDLMNEYKINEIERCDIKLIVYDLFYNAGPKAGALVSQRALNRYHNGREIDLMVDGKMGNETLRYLNKIDDLKFFILIFTDERLKYYSNLKNWEKYKNGWKKRIYSFFEIKELKCQF
ncbi:MAG: glycosyl hydrolase 108 family protein [Cetobacterium sp.]|uniref:glycosyl hydrolase 108 family protein n=1 Tax=Cetobacterium sp. TaxID=2071632 RepID=UPI003EE4397A